MLRLLASTIGAVCLAGSAEATVYTFTASGQIASYYGAAVSSDPVVGTMVRFEAVFDTSSMEVIQFQTTPATYLYGFRNALMTLTVGDKVYRYISSLQTLQVSLQNDVNRLDLGRTVDTFNLGYSYSPTNPAAEMPFAWLGGFAAYSISYSSSDPTASALSSNRLPDDLTLAGFPGGSLGVGASGAYSKGFSVGNVVATLAESPEVVPEPSTWAMMIAGFGAIGGMMRRRAEFRGWAS